LKKSLIIGNDLGLHARAAAKIVTLSQKYESDLFISKDDHEVDGASILSILTLACPKGTEIGIRVVGEDAQDLLMDVTDLFEQKFGEEK
jgi:phosphocarrier protein